MVYGWTFLYPHGTQEVKGKKSSFERFDRNGYRTEEIYYDRNGLSSFSCQYVYDENGNEIKKMGGQGEEVIYEQWKYSFLEGGNHVERRSEFRSGKEQKWIYSLDVHKNKFDEIYYDVTGMLSSKWEFAYDGNQNIVEKKELDAYGNTYQRWEYKYDDKNNNIEMYHYVSNNQLNKILQMRYDKKGNMKSKFTLDKDQNILELTVYVFQFYDGIHAPKVVGNK